MDETYTAGVVAIVMAIFKGLEKLTDMAFRYFRKNQPSKTDTRLEELAEDVEQIKAKTDKMYDMHNAYDSDGRPLWYMPRSIFDLQEKMVDKMHEISISQARIADALIRLEQKNQNN